MAKILKLSDRVEIKVGDVSFFISPLSWKHKAEILSHIKRDGGDEKTDYALMSFLTLKYSLKDVKGLKFFDDSDYVLTMDKDGCPNDDSISEVLQCDASAQLITAANKLFAEMADPNIPGVEVKFPGGEKKISDSVTSAST